MHDGTAYKALARVRKEKEGRERERERERERDSLEWQLLVPMPARAPCKVR